MYACPCHVNMSPLQEMRRWQKNEPDVGTIRGESVSRQPELVGVHNRLSFRACGIWPDATTGQFASSTSILLPHIRKQIHQHLRAKPHLRARDTYSPFSCSSRPPATSLAHQHSPALVAIAIILQLHLGTQQIS